MIRHRSIISANKWAHLLKDTKNLKSCVTKIVTEIENTNIAEEMYPTSNSPKLKIRGPIGEIIALGFFNLTRLDNRVSYDNAMHTPIAYDEKICKGLTYDDRGVDIIMKNKHNNLTTCQVKLIGNSNHKYGTEDYERLSRASYIEESTNILMENDIIVKQDDNVRQQVFWMTCQAMPDYTSEAKLRGKVRQLCFSKTDNKKGILNINDFTNYRFMNSLYELIMDSSATAKQGEK